MKETLNALRTEGSCIIVLNPNSSPKNVERSAKLDDKLIQTRQTLAYQMAYFKESFSDELWQAMDHRNLNQSQFAERADVSKQFITKIFRAGNCTMETIVKLAYALNYRAHIHLTPNDVGCEWIHQIHWTMPHRFDPGLFSGTKYHNVNQIEKEMNYAALAADT